MEWRRKGGIAFDAQALTLFVDLHAQYAADDLEHGVDHQQNECELHADGGRFRLTAEPFLGDDL